MTLALLAAYTLACIVVVIVPGPTVTVIIANSLRDGPRAGLLNVAGTQAGLVPMVLTVAFGLQAVIAVMADWFFWVKLAGAAYLIWLGLKLWRSTGDLGSTTAVRRPASGYFWQGFFVILSNPKALLFFGAFIPQFVDPNGHPFVETIVLGAIFMAVATVFELLLRARRRPRGRAADAHPRAPAGEDQRLAIDRRRHLDGEPAPRVKSFPCFLQRP